MKKTWLRKGVDRITHNEGGDISEKVVREGPAGLVTGARRTTPA